MADEARDIVDWAYFEKSRTELGPGFIRILSYFKEDGTKSIAQIEAAMREQNTTALVLPAHTLKGESRQLGAEPLAKIAELIETTARFCIEIHRFPDELVPQVVELVAVRPDHRAVRQGHQPADDPRRARRLWAQGRTTRASAGSNQSAVPAAHQRHQHIWNEVDQEVGGDQRDEVALPQIESRE